MSEQKKLNNKKDIEIKIISRAWEDENFKGALLKNPREAIQKEFKIIIPPHVEIKILEETANTLYFIIPRNPDKRPPEKSLADEELDSVAGGGDTFTIGGDL